MRSAGIDPEEVVEQAYEKFRDDLAADRSIVEAARERNRTIQDAEDRITPTLTMLPGERDYWSDQDPERWRWVPRGMAGGTVILSVLMAVVASWTGMSSPVGSFLVHHWWAGVPAVLLLYLSAASFLWSRLTPVSWRGESPAPSESRAGNWPVYMWVLLTIGLLVAWTPLIAACASLLLLCAVLILPGKLREKLHASLDGRGALTVRDIKSAGRTPDPYLMPPEDRVWMAGPARPVSLPDRVRTGDSLQSPLDMVFSLRELADHASLDPLPVVADADLVAAAVVADVWVGSTGCVELAWAADYGADAARILSQAVVRSAGLLPSVGLPSEGPEPVPAHNVGPWWQQESVNYVRLAELLPENERSAALRAAYDDIVSIASQGALPLAVRRRLDTLLYAVHYASWRVGQ